MKKRVIVFGIGRVYQRQKEWINAEYHVVGLMDNYPDNCHEEMVRSVETTLGYFREGVDFDSIIITTKSYEEMYNQLLTLGIDRERIIIFSHDKERLKRHYLDYSFYGQHADDLVLAAIFSMIGLDKPSYLDLGANHPFDINNTVTLYENGCRGINVDANEGLIELFNKLRPEDINLNYGIAGQGGGVLPFYKFGEYSGLNTFSKDEAEKWGLPITEVVDIPVVSLDYIIEKYSNGVFPDFLDCDIEGMDFEVLESFDLLNNGPKVICVEVRREEIEMFDDMLHEKGYFRFCRLGENNIYVKNRYAEVLIHNVVD